MDNSLKGAVGPTDSKTRKSRGHMFLVDVPTYAAVCNLGDPDVAAVYLILAAGTGADNRTSTWSREAVNRRTALNWRQADACFNKLQRHGFLNWISGKSTRKPRLDLPPIETRMPLKAPIALIADRITWGAQPLTEAERSAAKIGKQQGWLAEDDDGFWHFVAERPMIKAYLPNSLIGDETGKPTIATTIVDRIRQARDPMALRLLVDLYALQDLAENRGVDRHFLRKEFTRKTVVRTGDTQIWKFTAADQTARVSVGPLSHHARKPTSKEKAAGGNCAKDFFERVVVLEDAGALEWVYFLAEEDADTAVLSYPVAVERQGKLVSSELETIVGSYAIRAACAVSDSTSSAEDWEASGPNEFLLPADRLAKTSVLVGVARLRYRAKTTNTARWRKELADDAIVAIANFRRVIADHAPELLIDPDRRFADFNALSTESSTLAQRDINYPFKSQVVTAHRPAVVP